MFSEFSRVSGHWEFARGEYGFFFFFLFHVLSMAQERVLYLQARRNGSQGFAVVLMSHGGLVCN
jgi:hypothetical protein